MLSIATCALPIPHDEHFTDMKFCFPSFYVSLFSWRAELLASFLLFPATAHSTDSKPRFPACNVRALVWRRPVLFDIRDVKGFVCNFLKGFVCCSAFYLALCCFKICAAVLQSKGVCRSRCHCPSWVASLVHIFLCMCPVLRPSCSTGIQSHHSTRGWHSFE